MNLYFTAPARWSSGLSMTGLFANFDGDRNDDWASIEPSRMWWVEGTPSSAFANPTYMLDHTNRITKEKPTPWVAKSMGTTSLAEIPKRRAIRANGDSVVETDWTDKDELEAFKEVDPLTTKMRKRLFAKMVAEGVIERKLGEKKPTTGLAAVELDIMPFEGMRPDHLRIEQQMMLAKEWKVLSPKQRTFILAGKVVSSTAVGMTRMCEECVKGTEECVTKQIVSTPKAIGIMYKDDASRTACNAACLPWLDPKLTNAVCKCKIDCTLDVPLPKCTSNAISNYLSARTSWMIPLKGSLDKRCINLKSPATKVWKGTDPDAPERMWEQNKAPNFALSFWWRPDPIESYKISAIKSLIYKGPATDRNTPVVPDVKPLHIQVDGTNPDTPELLVTVAGVQGRVPFAKCPTLKDGTFTQFAVTKRDKYITVWCGADEKDACKKIMGKDVSTDEVPCITKVHTFELDANAKYTTSKDDAIYIIQPAATQAQVPAGFMGKFAYVASGEWDPKDSVKLWDTYIPRLNSYRSAVPTPSLCVRVSPPSTLLYQ